MLKYSLPKKENSELLELVKQGDKETIILCHLRLASSLAKRFGPDDEYFDAAVYGLVLGVERLSLLTHGNITGFLVHWMNRYIRESLNNSIPVGVEPGIPGTESQIDLNDQLASFSDLDQAIISMRQSGFSIDEVCEHLGTTRWFIQKAESLLKNALVS